MSIARKFRTIIIICMTLSCIVMSSPTSSIDSFVTTKTHFTDKSLSINRSAGNDHTNGSSIPMRENGLEKDKQLRKQSGTHTRSRALNDSQSFLSNTSDPAVPVKETTGEEGVQENGESEISFDNRFMSQDGIFYIMLMLGVYVLISFGVFFIDDMRYYRCINNIHSYFDASTRLQKLLASSKYLIIAPLFILYFMRLLFLSSKEGVEMVFSFSILPLIGLLLFTSRFLYEMNLASMPVLLQILLMVIQIVVIFLMSVIGHGLFDCRKPSELIKRNPVVATMVAFASLYMTYTMLLIFLPLKYRFAAKYIHSSAIISFFYGAVIGLRVLSNLIRWINNRHVSSDSQKQHENRIPVRADNSRAHAYMSLLLGLVCSVLFVAVAYFGASFMETYTTILIQWLVKNIIKLATHFNISNMTSVIKGRADALLNTLNIISFAN
ncbi:hypothetical protein NEAUS03_1095 [Nematocida ausubeli]|nr:hypothetical protein NEAUS03_1095 [Nematocida ausubeli]